MGRFFVQDYENEKEMGVWEISIWSEIKNRKIIGKGELGGIRNEMDLFNYI